MRNPIRSKVTSIVNRSLDPQEWFWVQFRIPPPLKLAKTLSLHFDQPRSAPRPGGVFPSGLRPWRPAARPDFGVPGPFSLSLSLLPADAQTAKSARTSPAKSMTYAWWRPRMFFRASGSIVKTARERIPSSLRSRLCFARTNLGDDIGNTLALCLPAQRRVDGQIEEHHFFGQSLVEDRGLDVRSQGRQVDHAAHVAAVDLFSIRDFREVACLPAFNLPQPTVTTGQGHLQRRRSTLAVQRSRNALWHNHLSPSAIALNADRNGHRDAAILRPQHHRVPRKLHRGQSHAANRHARRLPGSQVRWTARRQIALALLCPGQGFCAGC